MVLSLSVEELERLAVSWYSNGSNVSDLQIPCHENKLYLSLGQSYWTVGTVYCVYFTHICVYLSHLCVSGGSNFSGYWYLFHQCLFVAIFSFLSLFDSYKTWIVEFLDYALINAFASYFLTRGVMFILEQLSSRCRYGTCCRKGSKSFPGG